MKQETNNEIDLLLRRLSRRQEVPVSDADLRIDTDHLDADELSSYAENALPAAARARYTEHLADCSRCRETCRATQRIGSGVVAASRDVDGSGPSGLRKFLASFFSPMVLRYAVPALGLIVVAVIGFAVFRQIGLRPLWPNWKTGRVVPPPERLRAKGTRCLESQPHAKRISSVTSI